MSYPTKEEMEKLNAILANEPYPDIGVEFKLSSSPWYKPIIIKVESYTDTHGNVLTVHSGKVNTKTKHWIKKEYWKSRNSK